MKRFFLAATCAVSLVAIAACEDLNNNPSAKDAAVVERQQAQYAIAQPVPVFDWSLERDLVRQLYNARNMEVATHSVWRSDLGTIEGDCPSIGFGLPYDTSLTNPLVIEDRFVSTGYGRATGVTEQPEPNGIFASKNTQATWIMCAGAAGTIEPVYVETRVTSYPYPVNVDYATNRVTKAGKATVALTSGR